MEAIERPTSATSRKLFLATLIFICISHPIDAQELISRNTDNIEERLAVINADRIVRTDDATVVRFRFILSALTDSSGESASDVADKLVTGRRLLREKFGKDIALLDFAEAVYQGRATIAKRKLSEHISRLVVIIGTR
ncbi:MAG: hypothetical protein ACOY4O_07550 [Pseudomonadota bacterium]